jgi:hypothetical protein
MTLNEQLLELYSEKLKQTSPYIFAYNQSAQNNQGTESDLATNPFLISTPKDWSEAKIKVMVFGQETNYWGGEVSNEAIFSNEVEKLMNIYEEFYLKDNMYASPFWNTFREIRNAISKTNSSTSFIWNNIVKIGRRGIGYIPEVRDLTNKYFDVIPGEIDILKPNIIIFLSGPNYDNSISEVFGNFTLEPLIIDKSSRQLAIIKFEIYPFLQCFRTYHPGYLNRDTERKNQFLECIYRNIEINKI